MVLIPTDYSPARSAPNRANKALIQRHLDATGSHKARAVLDGWDHYLPRFWKVTPKGRAAMPASETGATTTEEKEPAAP